MRKILGVLPVLLAVGLLTGCGGSDSGSHSSSEIEGVSHSCAKFVEQGAKQEEDKHLGATVEDMDRALSHCDSVDEVEAADAAFPGLFTSGAIGMTVENRCEHNPDLRDRPICEK